MIFVFLDSFFDHTNICLDKKYKGYKKFHPGGTKFRGLRVSNFGVNIFPGFRRIQKYVRLFFSWQMSRKIWASIFEKISFFTFLTKIIFYIFIPFFALKNYSKGYEATENLFTKVLKKKMLTTLVRTVNVRTSCKKQLVKKISDIQTVLLRRVSGSFVFFIRRVRRTHFWRVKYINTYRSDNCNYIKTKKIPIITWSINEKIK